MASAAELSAMRQAILLSARGLGTTSPNPPVGCVILDTDGRVVGTGFHRRKGEPHAEVHALRAAGPAALGGTAVVTLEPCNHVGVTPACRQELLDAGIARVVIGLIDPTSRGEGGAAVLTEADVDVEVGVLREEVLTVLRPWLTATSRHKPYVVWAYAVDGDNDRLAEQFQLRSLGSGVDMIVTGDLTEEGSPGGHSERHFHLADLQQFKADADAWLKSAYAAGVRSILLLGPSRASTALQSMDAIDELILVMSRAAGSDLSGLMSDDFKGFELTDVTHWNHEILTSLRQGSASSSDL
jgi:diaminohydroxyphosphoribosylaminopyrimidine deaminase/5-amino-6-(5-phosphoribosylamino)uracil reductase